MDQALDGLILSVGNLDDAVDMPSQPIDNIQFIPIEILEDCQLLVRNLPLLCPVKHVIFQAVNDWPGAENVGSFHIFWGH